MRGRLLFVKHPVAHILSLQGMVGRHLGAGISCHAIKRVEERDAEILFGQPHLVVARHWANKLATASYCLMRGQLSCEVSKLFR